MSRYTGPRLRVARALGCDLPGLTTNKIERNPTRPGQHGAARQKVSDYGLRLREKQKLRFNYGIGETQLRNLVVLARRSDTAPGEKLIELIERRLDNVVYRAGYAATIPAARQLVNHGHVRVNNRRVTIPSLRVFTGDVITITEKARDNEHVKSALGASVARPEWIEFEDAGLTATIKALPTANEIQLEIDLRLVVEFYANRI